MQKRPDQGVWAKLWEFPGGRVEQDESPEQAIVREFMEETGFAVRETRKLGIIRHGYTTYRLTLHCFELELRGAGDLPLQAPPAPPVLTAATEWRWAAPEELEDLAMPAAHRKLADGMPHA